VENAAAERSGLNTFWSAPVDLSSAKKKFIRSRAAVRTSMELCAMKFLGKKVWAIAEGYIPDESSPAPESRTHEACCTLNASPEKAHVDFVRRCAFSFPPGRTFCLTRGANLRTRRKLAALTD